ncbi:hypothetical protein ACFPRL_23670 [Pseudoclavibacter helvolus]
MPWSSSRLPRGASKPCLSGVRFAPGRTTSTLTRMRGRRSCQALMASGSRAFHPALTASSPRLKAREAAKRSRSDGPPCSESCRSTPSRSRSFSRS